MTVPTFDREKEAIMKDVREMIHRNRDNGFILEELQNKYKINTVKTFLMMI